MFPKAGSADPWWFFKELSPLLQGMLMIPLVNLLIKKTGLYNCHVNVKMYNFFFFENLVFKKSIVKKCKILN